MASRAYPYGVPPLALEVSGGRLRLPGAHAARGAGRAGRRARPGSLCSHCRPCAQGPSLPLPDSPASAQPAPARAAPDIHALGEHGEGVNQALAFLLTDTVRPAPSPPPAVPST